MIKRVDDLKYTKQLIIEKSKTKKTKKRIWLIDILDALIIATEEKETLKGLSYYDTLEDKAKNIDSIMNDLQGIIQSINNAKNLYNYLNNKTLKELILTFGDLLQLIIAIRLQSIKQREEKEELEDQKEWDNIISKGWEKWTDHDYQRLLYINDRRRQRDLRSNNTSRIVIGIMKQQALSYS